MIQDGSKVTLHYTLTVDSQVVDSSVGGEPLAYEHGAGQIIPGLEQQLYGLNAGDKKDVSVAPEHAYDMPDPAAFQTVPRAAFREADELQVGDRVSGQMEGRPFHARVSDVRADDVTLDLNHPLAGKTLYFAIEIVGVM